ncbi:Ribose import ATP-binding protein RbsA [Sodalis praecaptivus]
MQSGGPRRGNRRAGRFGRGGALGAGAADFRRTRKTGGQIALDGRPVSIGSPRAAIALGIEFLTENRKEQGYFLELAAHENIVMPTLTRDARFGLINRAKARRISAGAIDALQIRVPHAQVRAGGLSGGNQQKLLLSRWVAIRPRILLLDEPTSGVDVGAKSEIYRMMNDMASQGAPS